MVGHLGTGVAGMTKGCPGVAPLLLPSARIAPHGRRRKVPLHPRGLRRATDGRAGPRSAVPKPGLIPKFSLPSLVILPLPPHAQACMPPAVTKSAPSGPCPWGRHFRVNPILRPGIPAQVEQVASALNWIQRVWTRSLLPSPPMPLIPSICLVMGVRLRYSGAGGGGDHTHREAEVAIVRFRVDPHCGAEGTGHPLAFSNHSSPFFLSPPPPAVVHFSALQMLSSEKS